MASGKDEAEGHDGKLGKESSMSAKVGDFLKKNLTKGELALKHAAGLGNVPNAVPETEPVLDGEARPVEVGWHPVGGLAGKWFAERTGLGKMITDKINKYPDPTQHWAVLVGDYAHQLWMDENFDVIYTNEKIKREEWRTFKVGETRFNDDATRRAGESVIQSIREKQPAYNLITNNCQTYALQLLDAIKVGSQKEFGTTLAVYERLTGPGRVIDLFVDTQQPAAHPEAGETLQQGGTVSFANQVMHENTTQLDAKEEMDKDDDNNDVDDDDDDNNNDNNGSVNGRPGNGERGVGEEKSEKQGRTRKFFSRILKK
ncbi:hypothetical protein QQS21_000803 [Conoideocrella luteorostrata]|uniref:DUF862-domain-containing protein n=1 Tax=Conoideocrella luteorostrata TaxID=1105319 RepID=A0AAJ0CY14_9HYPO|nr:hypothetical protein QQS21_000803 [Conoideocrella luteorostrata]